MLATWKARPMPWRMMSGGEVVTAEGGSLTWRLPDTPGIYQAEVILDYGDDGFSIDTLQLEVG